MLLIKGQNKKMARYLLGMLGDFQKSNKWSGVELHHGFVQYINIYPAESQHKHAAMFPNTKNSIKNFLDNTIQFRKSNKHGRYWIKTKDEYEELIATLQDLAR